MILALFLLVTPVPRNSYGHTISVSRIVALEPIQESKATNVAVLEHVAVLDRAIDEKILLALRIKSLRVRALSQNVLGILLRVGPRIYPNRMGCWAEQDIQCYQKFSDLRTREHASVNKTDPSRQL